MPRARKQAPKFASEADAWMAKEDRSGRLAAFLDPGLTELKRSLALVEG